MLMESVIVLAIAYVFALILPGLERKVQARIQQRYGPPVSTPGLWSILKFTYKRSQSQDSPSPRLYSATLVVAFVSISLILLFSTPYMDQVLGFATILGIAGLLKIEEATYLFQANMSRSIMSKTMPFPDTLEGGKARGLRSYFEDVAATRSLKMITFGSFPFYLALAMPFIAVDTTRVSQVIMSTPSIASISGILGAVVYFFGVNLITNNRPFDIIKPKVDIIEGPYMEYMAKQRALTYEVKGLLIFVLSSMFVTLYLGIPFDVMDPVILAKHLILALVIPVACAILKAFSPVLTFKQIIPITTSLSFLGMLAIGLNYVGL